MQIHVQRHAAAISVLQKKSTTDVFVSHIGASDHKL